jgi:hypothetical protein
VFRSLACRAPNASRHRVTTALLAAAGPPLQLLERVQVGLPRARHWSSPVVQSLGSFTVFELASGILDPDFLRAMVSSQSGVSLPAAEENPIPPIRKRPPNFQPIVRV